MPKNAGKPSRIRDDEPSKELERLLGNGNDSSKDSNGSSSK